MKKLLLAGCVVLLAAGAIVTAALAHNGNGKKSISAELEGFQEVPSIYSKAEGEIKLKLNGSSIKYELEYSGFGTGTPPNNATAAHIHFAQEGVPGGIAAFLCGDTGGPACPPTSGTVKGTITAANVKAIAAQGLAAGDIAALIRAIKAGYTYANVHSTTYTGGEIRGQIGDDDDDHGDRHDNGGRGKHKGNNGGDNGGDNDGDHRGKHDDD
jgi:hypothetical protein